MLIVLDEILLERQRQIHEEKYPFEHDDAHNRGEIAFAAIGHTLASRASDYPDGKSREAYFWNINNMHMPSGWTCKPKTDPRRHLIIAAALLVAEIERLDRAQKATT